jgi:selenoprotein W-related protein
MDLYKQKVGRFVLVPSDGGRFEVTVDGEPVWSKLDTGSFPETRTIAQAVDARLRKR